MSELLVSRTRDRPDYSAGRAAPPVDLRLLLGTWVNHNTNSTGIVRMHIAVWEGIPTVQVFGAGPSAPIDWGEAAGAAFATGVGGQRAVAFRVSFDLKFAYVQVVGRLNRRLLVVGAFSAFTDRSGRANYFQQDHLYRP